MIVRESTSHHWSDTVLKVASVAIPLAIGARFGRSLFVQGARQRVVELIGEAGEAVRTSAYWKRIFSVGAISGLIRGGYDSIDMRVRNKEIAGKEIAFNIASAALWGALCASIVPRLPQPAGGYPGLSRVGFRPKAAKAITALYPFHFVGLDILGDFSKDYLTNIRERLGDPLGLTVSGGLLLFENAFASCALVPFVGDWRSAIIRTLWISLLTVAFEAIPQIRNGRSWSNIDTGRLVGTMAWAHSSFLLMESAIGGAALGGGAREIGARTAELTVKQVLFVNPSLSNFDTRINEKNRVNVLAGNTFRYSTIMLPARMIQARLGPTQSIGTFLDFGFSILGVALANEYWRQYEGVSEIWGPKFLDMVRQTHNNRFDNLTDFLSGEMGSFEFVGLRYMPSELNLETVIELISASRLRFERTLFEKYLRYLESKGMQRTPQESRILRVCGKVLLRDPASTGS